MNGFSIIICCYNSASVIVDTLRSIANLVFAHNKLEVIIVDNNCSDDTVYIAKSLWHSLNTTIPLNVVKENKPGLSYARKAGVLSAKFSYLVFCDDDNFLSNDYLKIAFEKFEKDINIGVVGGQGIAQTNGYFPGWFENYKHAYACGPQYFKSANLSRITGSLYGAGLCFRKSLISKIFQVANSQLTDRKANSLTSGGDSELCFYAVLYGYEIYYEERMIFFHQIKQERLTLNYLHKLYEGFGKAHYYLYPLERAVLEKKQIKNMPISYLLSQLKTNLRFLIQYLVKGALYSGTVKGAWLWGLLKSYINNIF